jgi:hypothetical protein
MTVVVTGLTAERMIEMEEATVIDGDVVGNNLILHTRGGDDIDTGNVRGPTGATGAAGTNGTNGAGDFICTSGTRPASPVEGYSIYETDTDLRRTWTGTRWKVQEYIIFIVLGREQPGRRKNAFFALAPRAQPRFFPRMRVFGSTKLTPTRNGFGLELLGLALPLLLG